MRLLKMLRLSIVLLLLMSIVPSVYAQSAQNQRYISDELELPMRSGASTQFRIIRMLTSGTPVTLVDTDPATGYSRVRTADGTLGFVQTRYLNTTPSVAERLTTAEAALQSQRDETQRLRERLASVRELEQQLKTFEESNRKLSEELNYLRTVAANPAALDERNRVLEEQVIGLERSLQLARQENEVLSDRRNQDWFVRGAGVLMAGLIAGLVLPRLRSRRSSRWGEL